jgi:hypothetical protein
VDLESKEDDWDTGFSGLDQTRRFHCSRYRVELIVKIKDDATGEDEGQEDNNQTDAHQRQDGRGREE